MKRPMADQQPKTKFSHVKPNDTKFHGDGLRDFFEYRDLGIADATNGQVVAHLVRAPAGTGTSPTFTSSS